MTLLRAADVSLSFGSRTLFDKIEFVIEEGERCLVAPEDNTLVLFDAGLLHEVQPVTSPRPLAFEEGRFTINGWLWR
jgi:Rps23 Pro-64 3,4-dihydroxylase Tpa1-like proline 4-hydroxylase